MGKTKPFVFDASAFIMGTQTMSHHEVGQYIRILATMADKGRMDEKTIVDLFGMVEEAVKKKFHFDRKGLWYNVRLEKEITKFEKSLEKIPMTEQESKDYKECMAIYYEWYEKLTSTPPKIFAGDCVALKQLIAHFRDIIAKKNLDSAPSESFQLIFLNWNKLNPQLQQQTKLMQINSNINNIINQLKNGGIKRISKVDTYKSSTDRITEMLNKRTEGNKAI